MKRIFFVEAEKQTLQCSCFELQNLLSLPSNYARQPRQQSIFKAENTGLTIKQIEQLRNGND